MVGPEPRTLKGVQVSEGEANARMAPSNFVTMEEFRDRKLRPGEALSVYLHDLRQ